MRENLEKGMQTIENENLRQEVKAEVLKALGLYSLAKVVEESSN